MDGSETEISSVRTGVGTERRMETDRGKKLLQRPFVVR